MGELWKPGLSLTPYIFYEKLFHCIGCYKGPVVTHDTQMVVFNWHKGKILTSYVVEEILEKRQIALTLPRIISYFVYEAGYESTCGFGLR